MQIIDHLSLKQSIEGSDGGLIGFGYMHASPFSLSQLGHKVILLHKSARNLLLPADNLSSFLSLPSEFQI